MIDVLKTGKWSPIQALLEAQSIQDDMSEVVVVFMRKGEDIPRFIHSSMRPVDMYFFGGGIQAHAFGLMKE